MTTHDWTTDSTVELLEKAWEAGLSAAKIRYAMLSQDGPEWRIESSGLDICGYGAIHIRDARMQSARAIIDACKGDDEHWSVRRDFFRGGYLLQFWHMGAGRQELSVNRVANEAAAQVLRDAGLDCNVVVWTD